MNLFLIQQVVQALFLFLLTDVKKNYFMKREEQEIHTIAFVKKKFMDATLCLLLFILLLQT